MARALRINYPGAFYHVTSRGNEQKAGLKINGTEKNSWNTFQTATLQYNAVIHLYCVMDNHYHRFLETPSPSDYAP